MATNRVDELFDIAAIDAQKAKIAAMLNDIKTNLDDLQKLGKSIQIGGSVSGSEGNTQKAAKALDELNFNVQEYNKLLKQNEALQAKMNVLTSDAAQENARLSKAYKELKAETDGSAKALRDAAAAKQAEKQAAKDAAAAKKLDAQMRQIEIAGSKEAVQIQKELEKQKKQLEAATKQEAKEQAIAAKNVFDLANAYDVLNAKHKAAVKEYQNAAAANKLSATEITALKDRANDLGQQLVKIDAAVGNYRRNVGNYSSAWNGLGVSIQQVAREMPNFAQSFQLGILAISNNLPILADEIKRAKDNIAELKAEGKSAPSLFSQIAASVFSWQTALTIGITLLVKYGAEIADWVMQVSDAEKMTRKYQEALKDSISTESSGIAKLYALKAALADTTNARSNDLAAFSAVKKEYPEYFDYLNTEKASLKELNLIIDQQIKARIENAKQVALNKVAADATNEYVQAQNNLNKEIGFWEKNTSFAIGSTDKLTTETKRLYQAYKILFEEGKIGFKEWLVYQNRIEDISNAEKQMTSSTNALTKSLLKLKDAVNSMDEDELINLENNVIKYKEGTKKRLNAEILFIKQKRDIKIRQLQQEFNGDAMLLAGNRRYQAEKLNIELKAQREIESIRNSFAKSNKVKIKKEKQEVSKDTIDIITQISREINLIGAEELANREKRLEDLRGLLEADVISVATYEKQKQVIIKNSEAEILRLQTERLGAILNEIGLSEQNTQKVKQMFYDKSIDLLKKQTDAEEAELLEREKHRRNFDKNNLDSLKEKEALEKRLAREKEQYKREIAQETANFIFTLLDAQVQKEVELLETQKERISERYEQERNAIDAAFLSDEEKAARKQVLDAEEAERQKVIDDEIRQKKRKAAILEKVQALATITINTAIALSNPLNLASFGALSPLIIGLGAAQAAAVIATPIPEYAKGKKETDSYEGLAIAGEKGTELMIDKEGKLSLLTKPTLINTRRGDRIYSSQELRQGVANERIAEAQVYDNTEVVRALGYGFGSLNSTIKNKKPDTIILDQTRYYDLQRAARR